MMKYENVKTVKYQNGVKIAFKRFHQTQQVEDYGLDKYGSLDGGCKCLKNFDGTNKQQNSQRSSSPFINIFAYRAASADTNMI